MTGADHWAAIVDAVPTSAIESATFVEAAGRGAELLPASVLRALTQLSDPTSTGAVLIKGVPSGAIPRTPPTPTTRTEKDHVSEFVLLSVARALGEPVGYAPEHGGAIVQNLVPTPEAATRQTSTSSAVELEFHTETVFHPHRPHHLLLLCLRGDPAASTLLCSVDQVVAQLPPDVRRVLGEPRFRTGVDESFIGASVGPDHDAAHDESPLDRPLDRLVSVLSGDPAHPTLTFDADLMHGIDDEADAALAVFASLARAHRIGVTLEPGDLLVVDNHRSIHGRSAFTARYDGTDRWLQRSFVVDSLAPSVDERHGRVITTRFDPGVS
ncbi:clavaminate synthase family protein [soil metagenome]